MLLKTSRFSEVITKEAAIPELAGRAALRFLKGMAAHPKAVIGGSVIGALTVPQIVEGAKKGVAVTSDPYIQRKRYMRGTL